MSSEYRVPHERAKGHENRKRYERAEKVENREQHRAIRKGCPRLLVTAGGNCPHRHFTERRRTHADKP